MPAQDPEYSKFSETLVARQIPIRMIAAGDVLKFQGVTANVLWPDSSMRLDIPSQNNDSVVLRLQFGECTFLLTGDVEKDAENTMVRASENLRANVVKVAHHGSRTSSTESFIAAARPRFAVISVGQTSIFGHPNKDVVERWKTSGAEVLTTGKSGTITFTTNGHDLTLQTYVPAR
jgi:competence protein ComEC